MKTNLLNLFLVFLCLVFISCQAQPCVSSSDPYNLQELDWDLNAHKFYCESKETVVVNSDGIVIHGTPDSYDFLADGPVLLGPENTLQIIMDTARICWREKIDVYSDGIKKRGVLGIEYSVGSWTREKNVATYEHLTFQRLEMITDFNNKLIAVCAMQDDLKTASDLDELLKAQKEKTKVTHRTELGYYDRDAYKWETNACIYELVTEYQIEKDTYIVYMFIVKKESIEQLSKICKGNFRSFYPLLDEE